MTAILFHGPSALENMQDEPSAMGWYVPHAVFGLDEAGLKTDAARDFVQACLTPPATDKKICIQAWLNEPASAVQDVLLKSLEDHDSTRLVLCLAVNDMGSLLPTVRSRCHERWCGPKSSLEDEDTDDPAMTAALQIRSDLKAGKLAEALGPFRAKTDKLSPADLLDALAHVFRDDQKMWVQLRPLYSYNRVSNLDIVAALLSRISL